MPEPTARLFYGVPRLPDPGATWVNHNCFGVPECLRLLTAALLTSAAKDKGEKKLFGYSFVPLMKEDGRTLPDGTHELIIHKVTAAFSPEGPSLSLVRLVVVTVTRWRPAAPPPALVPLRCGSRIHSSDLLCLLASPVLLRPR